MEAKLLEDARIAIVDDEEANTALLAQILRQAGYAHITTANDPREVLLLITEFSPDIVLLDLHMPYLDGFQVLDLLAPWIPPSDYLPILVLTADVTREAKQKALSLGARDFLTKPFDVTEVLLRIKNLLQTRMLHRQLQAQNQRLEEKVQERTQELEEARLEILQRLALAAEYRDDDTGDHVRRVARTSALLAQAIGLPHSQVELIERAATLHDVGKIGVPDAILLKPGKLSDGETEIMRRHAAIGAQLLSGSRFALLQLAEQIASSHHEHWDGGGYGAGLRGEDIPLPGRIVAVADVFDALTHARPYKEPWSFEAAVQEVMSLSGRQFDPRVVNAFLSLVEQGLLCAAAD